MKKYHARYINIKKKSVGFKKNNKKRGLLFHYNKRADILLAIGYVDCRSISCRCSSYVRKLASPWNRSQDKYNQYQYKGENQNCIYLNILGSYNNWQIIHCIDSRKQQ